MVMLFFRIARRAGVYSDGMAAEKLRGLDPLVMVLDSLVAFGARGIAEVALAIAHNEAALYAEIVAALFELLQVGRILGLVHEEDVDVFDAVDIEILLGDFGEIEVVHLARLQCAVERPSGK